MNTTECTNCRKYTAVVTESDGHNWQHDFEPDGYTPSSTRHRCGESDRAVY